MPRKKNIAFKSTPPPPKSYPKPQTNNGLLRGVLEGFSFGTGAQLAREIFSTKNSNDTTKPLVNSTNNHCDALKKHLDQCEKEYVHDCSYLTNYIKLNCEEKNYI